MKRKGIWIALVFVGALLLAVAGRKEWINAKGEAVIAIPADSLISGLADTAYWVGFYGHAPETMISPTPGRIILRVSPGGDNPTTVAMGVYPAGTDSAQVVWIQQLTLTDWVKENFFKNGPVRRSLAALKTYAEARQKHR